MHPNLYDPTHDVRRVRTAMRIILSDGGLNQRTLRLRHGTEPLHQILMSYLYNNNIL